jgi:hypothetical protein
VQPGVVQASALHPRFERGRVAEVKPATSLTFRLPRWEGNASVIEAQADSTSKAGYRSSGIEGPASRRWRRHCGRPTTRQAGMPLQIARVVDIHASPDGASYSIGIFVLMIGLITPFT